MRLSARQLELFQTAYQLKSTRKAADALHVSQPAISRAVADLEIEIGVALFDRSGRKFEPTAAGHSLHQAMQKHYHGLGRVRDAAQQIATGTGGHLRVAALPAVADTKVAAAAGRLMAQHPALRIDVDVLNEQNCLSQLRAGHVDCVVISSDPGEANLTCIRMADILPTVIVSINDPAAGSARITPEQLATQPQIMLPANSPFRRAVEHMFDRAGVSFQLKAEARTQAALVKIVAQGAGRAIVDEGSLGLTPGADVVCLSLAADLKWAIRIVTSSASSDTPGLQRLIRELLGHPQNTS